MQVIVLLLLAASLWGQSQLTLSSPGAQPVTGASTVVVGANRGQNIYYWVVARTPSGYTAPSGVVAFNTVGIANLDSSNYVTISWNAVPLATGYDVIRSSTASYPASTSCASCAVVLNQAGVTFNDQGGALSAYPPGGSLGVTDATGTFTVDDLTEQYPFLNFQLKTSRYDYTTRMTDTRSQITACTIVSGTANAIVCNGSAQSPTRPPIATLTGAGRLATVISLIPGTTNSGAVTINPDGIGAKTIQKLSSGSLTALSSGDLVAGVPYLIRYNGTVFVVDPGSGGGSSGGTANDVVVTYSATPTFNVPVGSLATTFNITLTGNITSATLQTTGAAALVAGQQITMRACQDGTGNHTFVLPTNMLYFASIETTASTCTTQTGEVDASLNVTATGPPIITNIGSIGQFQTCIEGTAPGNPPAGSIRMYCKTSDDSFHIVNSAGTDFAITSGGGTWSLNLQAGACDNAGSGNISLWNIAVVANPATKSSCLGTDMDQAQLNFGQTGSPTATKDFIFSSPWASGTATNVDLWIYQTTGSGDIKFTASIGCINDGGSGINFTYNATASTTVTSAASGVVKKITISTIPTSGSSTCAVGSNAMLKILRDNSVGSNMAGTASLMRARIYQ